MGWFLHYLYTAHGLAVTGTVLGGVGCICLNVSFSKPRPKFVHCMLDPIFLTAALGGAILGCTASWHMVSSELLPVWSELVGSPA